MKLLCLFGILAFPVFTFACVLFYYDHPVLAIIALIISLNKSDESK